jgi:hypothetical protein
MAVVFAGDQMSMPREQGVRADNGADFPEHPSRQELGFGGQANALIVGEAPPARAELRAEYAILGLEIVDHVALLLVDPARPAGMSTSRAGFVCKWPHLTAVRSTALSTSWM